MNINGGDYLVQQNLNTPKYADVDVATGDSATKTGVIPVKDANHTVFIQKITMSVIVDAAQSLIFQDNGTPLIIAKNKVSPGLGPIVWDFGPKGTPLTAGKELQIAISGAGLAARVHIEGYERLTSTIASNVAS